MIDVRFEFKTPFETAAPTPPEQVFKTSPFGLKSPRFSPNYIKPNKHIITPRKGHRNDHYKIPERHTPSLNDRFKSALNEDDGEPVEDLNTGKCTTSLVGDALGQWWKSSVPATNAFIPKLDFKERIQNSKRGV